MSKNGKPDKIDGGCLCQSVRYTVTLPPDHDFANACSTCQCSQCRKNTGSLLFRGHRVPKSAISFSSNSSSGSSSEPGSQPTTLRLYSATPGYERGFCTNCGSFLFWQTENRPYISLAVGCFDNEVLRRFGPLLTTASRNLFCENEIPGVTDHLQGRKFLGDGE